MQPYVLYFGAVKRHVYETLVAWKKCSPQNVRAKTNFYFLVLNYEYELTIQN